ncbi:hypothetical protein [Pseudomonas aeruginosa]|uniref:hypothetical protein n=2 Tax=Pseudomonas aeruginosa TaxID=287 RepID=UPI000F5458C9|nr:hypothetical protein [Pseudomonas aeruginosa]EIU1659550.1 hypothetical protein [Pseudomonas aeruginosa]MCX2521153.1 hypothetical protein [Pseudomonas aeruginosa]RUE78125.1 hypothetical protein IPC1218_11090 [Pseudomonas aeruginosa]HBN8811331.1 hypothetical protein [Pseudomonas aeruginosa]HBP1806552.1 hypothetical protein [Pseudomonas aeruginosa]
MSKQSYTPGPWEQRNNRVFSGGKCICSNVNAASPTTQNIAEDVAMSIANAKLIAAAPELLEACQAFKRLYGRLWDVVEPSGSGFLSPESVKEYDAIHELMTAAIAKATA